MLDVRTHPWHSRSHHTARGFRNVWEVANDPPFFKAAFWLLKHGLEPRSHHPPPVRSGAHGLHTPLAGLRITWIGHSSTVIQAGGRTLLTDPVFSDRVSPVPFAGPKREVDLPFTVADLPPVDAVLISHDHYDHLDRASVRALDEHFAPLFFVPLGVAPLLRSWGIERIVEMDWWQHADWDGWRVHCTPAQHFSGRGLGRDGTLWASWYLETPDVPVYYGGDSGYAPLFRTIRERLGPPDVALLPIGAYRPRWFMHVVHVEPAEAVQAFRDLEADVFIPIHWGTFDLAEERLHEAPAELLAAARACGLDEQIRLLDIGGTFEWSPGARQAGGDADRSRAA